MYSAPAITVRNDWNVLLMVVSMMWPPGWERGVGKIQSHFVSHGAPNFAAYKINGAIAKFLWHTKF